MAFRKFDFLRTIALLNLRNKWTKVHRTFFVERGRERYSASCFQISNISLRFAYIGAQSGKVSEIAQNLACFCLFFFWGGGIPPNFWTGIYKLNMLPNSRSWQILVKTVLLQEDQTLFMFELRCCMNVIKFYVLQCSEIWILLLKPRVLRGKFCQIQRQFAKFRGLLRPSLCE